MFKRWKPEKSKKDSAAAPTPPPDADSFKGESIHFETIQTPEEPIDPALEFAVLNNAQPQMPYGDGSDKVFGMENFGYTCYIASILQALYYTTPFRHEILSFPERDPSHPRKRKLRVSGHKPHAYLASLASAPPSSGSNGSTANGNGGAGVSQSSKVRSLFKQGQSQSTPSTAGTVEQDGTFELNNPEIEKVLLAKYPEFAKLNINYSLNQQKNITIVGVMDNPAATSEQRKRQALLRGPVINLDHSYSQEYGMSQSIFTALKDVFECVAENSSKVGIVSPQRLVEVVKKENEMFRSSMHQDAHEFLNFLINNVIESIDLYCKSTGRKSNIHRLFEGLLTSETKCLFCEKTSTRDEMFLDLSIDLQQDTSITHCLKMFSQSEMLTGSNKFYCDDCHSLQEAAKTIRLKKLPKILALHLKRFKYSEELGRNVKLFYRVEYSKVLRICNTTEDSDYSDMLYELYAVVVHIGGGPYHGHYVSLVKTAKFGWLLFDDETVECIDENFVYRFFGDGPGLATAYLLYYRQIEDEEKYTEQLLKEGLSSALDGEIDTSAFQHEEPVLVAPEADEKSDPFEKEPVETPPKQDKQEKKKRVFGFKLGKS
ncbi:hypothetical protein OGAPHI_001528 [Ogataea philodendri]|uniref:ubiquitinyl hydrolase 1 n=1 Tax=Ogataea philodendri TaxID=1378263 RepID=A0A9P8PCE5_9ASCO|nr:uncharacterized protein OGAPHI_001528 [Ogataea philodendri]KAH3669407.1 hypothetical protein OGAPHI_001528 [Ogataea philodendri]